jgi:hypothetical protein
MRGARAALAAACLLLACSGTASAEVLRAQLGDVSAQLVLVRHGGLVRDATLTLTRAGHVVFAGPITTAAGRPGSLQLRPRLRTFADASLRVLDLDGDGTGEAIVDLAERGAYCCSHSVIVGSGADGSYRAFELDWGSFGSAAVPVPLKDGYVLVGRDARLEERYTPHVLSFEPVRIWRYAHGSVEDVTREQPLLVQRDLGELLAERRTLLRRPNHRTIDLRGLLTAIAGDRLLLGRRAAAVRSLHADVAAGLVRVSSEAGPIGAAFPPALLRLLGRLGYP